MGLPVVTVAAGGLPIVESTVGGTPVTEATNGRGVPVTKVVGKPGLPVVFETIGVGVPIVPGAWNPADNLATTLSNSNLTSTSTGFGNCVRATKGALSGKYYWEITINVLTNVASGAGITATPAATGITPSNSFYIAQSGSILRLNTGLASLGTLIVGDIIGIGFDASANIWFRKAPSGNWNNSGTANPATNTGGFGLSTLAGQTLYPHVYLNASGDKATANFGGSAFVGAVPAGFTAGWPA